MRPCDMNDKVKYPAKETSNRQKGIHNIRRTQALLQNIGPEL